eukprot:GSChrysophyteH1.ASY1.ANO1.614.1 assembled CDS
MGNARKRDKKGVKGTGGRKKGSQEHDVFDSSDADAYMKRLRQHNLEGGEDSDNDATLRVSKRDDEDVDDDGSSIGWNSDDDLAYGSIFNKGGSESDQSDQEEAEEGEVLLSDLLDANRAKKNATTTAAKKTASKSESMKTKKSSRRQPEQDGSESDDDYDDSNSEGSQSDENSDEEDDDLDGVHARLLSAIDRFAAEGSGPAQKAKKELSLQHVPENQHSSVAEGWSGNNASVTMDALLNALDGEKNLGVVKAKLNDLEKNLAAPVYVEKVTADRAERVFAYDGSQADMGKWQDSVRVNRSARTLDVAQDVRIKANYKNLVRKHEPTTDMEKEIAMVLVKSGATEEAAEAAEEDELGARNLSVEELRQRQADLAKTRALLFYEQMKRHRINKIKSKAYHRIKKRQRVRKGQETALLAEQDPELLQKLQDDAATKRVRERMSLRHKSSGKFAKEMLRHGHGNKSMREAYNESITLGNELNEQVYADPSAGNDDGEDSDDGMSDSMSDQETSRSGKKVVAKKASKALRKAGVFHNDEENSENDDVVDGKYKKLFEMDFMKKAREQQKERAREEAQSVLREIEDMEAEYASDSDDHGETEKKTPTSEAIAAAKQKMTGLFSKNGGMLLKKKPAVVTKVESEIEDASSIAAQAQSGKSSADANPQDEPAQSAANPWLAEPTSKRAKAQNAKKASGAKQTTVQKALDTIINSSSISSGGNNPKSKKSMVEVKSSVSTGSTKVSQGNGKEGNAGNADPGKQREEKKELLEARAQEDLVNMAFAGPDLEDEFNQFKDKAVNDELGIDEKKKKIVQDVKAGWGDWAGPGPNGTQVSAKILNKRDKLMKAAEEEAEQKRKGRKDTKMANVMLSDRRIKTAAKFKVADIPHPFTSRAEYEKSLTMPVGEEWNASHVVRQNTKPDIFMRAGRVVEPIKLAKKREKQSMDAMAVRSSESKFGGHRKFRG